MNRETIKTSTGKWLIIRNQSNGLSWIGLIGEVRDSTDPWSDHDLEMFVAWNKGEPSWHEITIDDASYQSKGTRIRPKIPAGHSWIRTIGFNNRNINGDSFDVGGVIGKRFEIVDTPMVTR